MKQLTALLVKRKSSNRKLKVNEVLGIISERNIQKVLTMIALKPLLRNNQKIVHKIMNDFFLIYFLILSFLSPKWVLISF